MRGSSGGAAAAGGFLFQQRVGALVATAIVSRSRLDDRLGLGAAAPVWLRFETEAPVDDLLVATDRDGYVAIQAKTTADLSTAPRSPLARAVGQFVSHWLTCRDGDSSLGWNRPLDPSRDRLVLAVSNQASEGVRIDLPAALRIRRQPGSGLLTQAQQQAFDAFSLCVSQAWSSISSAPFDAQLVQELAKLVSVLSLDLGGADADSAQARLDALAPAGVDGENLWGLLVAICGEMMSRRSGGDRSDFVGELSSRGIDLNPSPQYRDDIERLRTHSLQVALSLERYESLEASSQSSVSIARECQSAVEAAAMTGSLLIIGEPGAGKSGVLNALARSLRQQDHDVLQLAVDRYSVASLESLSTELGLDNGLLEVLKQWNGPNPGWLVIDALDATRGGRGEGVFRALIERVQQEAGRWRVVASIRTFDLRMGVRFRNLFKGAPPVSSLKDPSFANVRHVLVPRWSKSEFERLLREVPLLGVALEHASPRLHDLASVPFNTRLLCELIAHGTIQGSVNRVSSQADLLELYWEERIESYGLAAKGCLRALVASMVESRSLKAPALLRGVDSTMVDSLAHEGVLIRVENDRAVQFRHHVLFDFSAAKTFLDPDELVSGARSFPKSQAQGLMLAPALSFLLKEIWDREPDHARFWQSVGNLVSDEECDPLIRSAAGRIGAEYPEQPSDALWLATQAGLGHAKAISTLTHICGALAIRLEDDSAVDIAPWVELVAALAAHVRHIAVIFNFAVHLLLPRALDPVQKAKLGVASRRSFRRASLS